MNLAGASFGTVLQLVFGNAMVQAALWLVLADVLSGIALSFYTKEFRLGAVADFLLTRAIPYFLGAGSLQLVLLSVPAEWSGIADTGSTTIWLFAVAALVGHLLDNLRQMGLPIPQVLGDKPKIEAQAKP